MRRFIDEEKTHDRKVNINHIKQNINLSSKIHKIREIQLFYRNFVKEANRAQIKQFQDEVDIVQR